MIFSFILNTAPFSLSALVVLALAHRILPPFKSLTLVDPPHHTVPQDDPYAKHPIIAFLDSISLPAFSSLSFAQKLALYQFLLNATIYTTLTSAVLTAELVLCEIINWPAPDARVIVWKLTTTILIAMLVGAIPLLELFALLYSSPIPILRRLKYPLTLLLYILWLLIFQAVGNLIPLVSHQTQPSLSDSTQSLASYYYSYYAANTRTLYEETLSRIVIIGVCAMAMLSGFAAVSTPYTLVFAPTPRQITDNDINRMKNSLETTTRLLTTKTRLYKASPEGHAAAAAAADAADTAASKSSTSSIILPKNISSASLKELIKSLRAAATGSTHNLSSSASSSPSSALEREIEALSRARRALRHDLRILTTTQAEQVYEKTPFGKVIKRSYNIFAIYCVYRLVSVLFLRNPIARARVLLEYFSGGSPSTPASQQDALATTIAHIVLRLAPKSSLDADAWTRQVSFILSGFLFAGSISAAITTFHSLTSTFPLLRLEPHLLFTDEEPENEDTYPSPTPSVSGVSSGIRHRSNSIHRSNLFPKQSSPASHATSSRSLPRVQSLRNPSPLAAYFDYPSFALLVISQVLGVYIISSSLLLRSNLPQELSSTITRALGAPLDTIFVEYLFEFIFAVIVLMTIGGIIILERYGAGLTTAHTDYSPYDEESLLETLNSSETNVSSIN
ncbi:uncharacterized protein SAPINGB_P001539 [Magnusiomyces paraingens]|uniref:Abscisic acid G-protein coupled receptor-like domain-containing protein n=1 Tax=Magnusiomyces paraingens TaxID=2606893 RepID=A0A5E8B6T8_9ASCO|nr:uncharacterized protein SAPINGB_P001539 [Saprochaete ingens]VVT47093.1 unnamed protein product [Saprochaete ingens]